jgi:hypothetical protein
MNFIMNSSRKSGDSICSFCKNKIREDSIDIMEFHFHEACSDNVRKALCMVEEHSQRSATSPSVTIDLLVP